MARSFTAPLRVRTCALKTGDLPLRWAYSNYNCIVNQSIHQAIHREEGARREQPHKEGKATGKQPRVRQVATTERKFGLSPCWFLRIVLSWSHDGNLLGRIYPWWIKMPTGRCAATRATTRWMLFQTPSTDVTTDAYVRTKNWVRGNLCSKGLLQF